MSAGANRTGPASTIRSPRTYTETSGLPRNDSPGTWVGADRTHRVNGPWLSRAIVTRVAGEVFMLAECSIAVTAPGDGDRDPVLRPRVRASGRRSFPRNRCFPCPYSAPPAD